MSANKEEADPELVSAVKRLGAGYKGKSWPVFVSLRGRGRGLARQGREPGGTGGTAAAEALRAGYTYRRPVPLPDGDDWALDAEEGKKASALSELEDGLAAAANGPPHTADGDGDADAGGVGDGDAGGDDNGGHDAGAGDDEEDGLYTADSASSASNSSVDTEAAVAFAMEWEDEDGDDAGGQAETDKKRASSHDPEYFQEEREAARNLLSMGAFFASTAKNMMDEHKRAKKEADLYMSEVTVAAG